MGLEQATSCASAGLFRCSGWLCWVLLLAARPTAWHCWKSSCRQILTADAHTVERPGVAAGAQLCCCSFPWMLKLLRCPGSSIQICDPCSSAVLLVQQGLILTDQLYEGELT